MSRLCERCQYDITVGYILKQESFSEIRCPNCGRLLEVTLLSKVLVLCYYVLGLLGLSVLPIGVVCILVFQYIWTVISYYYLPAFLYFYKEKNEDSLE